MIKTNLVVANGSYTDRNGSEKKRWVTIGALHAHDGREYVTLDRHINLAGLDFKEGETRIFASLFDPRPQEARAAAGKPAQPEFNDDVPW